MCGRYLLKADPKAITELLGVPIPPLSSRYNIAPSQQVLALRVSPPKSDREAVFLRWGLVPSWADDSKIGYKLINARSETAASKPSFRSAFKSRRCLIPAIGFYECKVAGVSVGVSFRLAVPSAPYISVDNTSWMTYPLCRFFR